MAEPDWSASVAFRYRKRSGQAWAAGRLEPVRHVADITYADLQEVDTQKGRFARNLAQFVAGQPANNVLLSGARGTGKSSLVKAGLHAHASQGLRLIEVDKADLIDLPDLIELVSTRASASSSSAMTSALTKASPATRRSSPSWMAPSRPGATTCC